MTFRRKDVLKMIWLWRNTELPLLTFFFAGLTVFLISLWIEEKLEILEKRLKNKKVYGNRRG